MKKYVFGLLFSIIFFGQSIGMVGANSNVSIFRGNGRTETTKFHLLANMNYNLGTGSVRIRERLTNNHYDLTGGVVNGIDVNGDNISDVFIYTFFDPQLPHFYALRVIVVMPGFSDMYPKGLIHYTVYDGGLHQYSVLEGVSAGSLKIHNK